jgi:integrase
MASLIKRGDFWYIKMYNHTGKQVMRKGYSDKRETQALAIQLEDEKTKMRRGDIDPKAEQRKIERAKEIGTHLAEYKLLLQAKGNSINHTSYTIADIQKFINFAKVNQAEAITRVMVDQWVLELVKAGADSRSTINRRVGSVKALLKHLYGIKTISEYVLLKYPKMKTKGMEVRKRRALEMEEQRKLLAKAGDRADLYKFCLGTGARHSGCVHLTVEDCNLTEKTVSMKVKDNQHRNKVHIVPMHPDLVPILQRRCEGRQRTEKVFDVPARSMAAKLLREDCKAAGVDTTHIDFHALRHSFITTLAKANIHPNVVQALAGHAKVETTLAYYTHFKRSDERAALEVMKI